MPTRSNEKIIKSELKNFIEHDDSLPKNEAVFLPKTDLTIGFFVEGGVYVAGDRETLRVNLNSSEMLVLLVEQKDGEHIYRFPWTRIIGFELIAKGIDDPELLQLFGVN